MQLIVHPLPFFKGRPPVITSGFGDSRGGGTRTHQGVDFLYKRLPSDTLGIGDGLGSKNFIFYRGTKCVATGPGVISEVRYGGTGLNIKIDHKDGWTSVYRHLISPSVTLGQTVKPGDVIGTVGDDPSNPGDPAHLHFELWQNGSPIDPAPYVKNLRVINVTNWPLILVAVVGGVWVARRLIY